MAFSTITTAPSTMMPKSSAPRLIRLALTLLLNMPVKVNNIDNGMTMAVISAARMLPRNRNNTAMTRMAPSTRFFFTVAMAFSTRLVRSYTVTATTPLGRLRLISTSLAATAWDTVRLFSPISMNTVPSTTSRPFSVAAPERSSSPRPTWATWLTRIGVPSTLEMTILAMSSADATWPGARISNCSPLRSM
ncbi:hypothetical protein D3C75_635530 [compost metagenome]